MKTNKITKLTLEDLEEFYEFDDALIKSVHKFIEDNNVNLTPKKCNTNLYVNTGFEDSKKISIYIQRTTRNEFTDRLTSTKKVYLKSVYLKNLIANLEKVMGKYKSPVYIHFKYSITIKKGVEFDSRKVITFGKYRGVNVDHLELLDLDYWGWLKNLVVGKQSVGSYIGSTEFTKYVYDTYCYGVDGLTTAADKRKLFIKAQFERLNKFCEDNNVSGTDRASMIGYLYNELKSNVIKKEAYKYLKNIISIKDKDEKLNAFKTIKNLTDSGYDLESSCEMADENIKQRRLEMVGNLMDYGLTPEEAVDLVVNNPDKIKTLPKLKRLI